MTYADYQTIDEGIHAPSYLKAEVLKKARAMERRRIRVLPRIAAAAALAAVIPLTVFAAVKMPGLQEYLSRLGMKDMAAVEQLVEAAPQTSPNSNEFADFSVQETLCDGNMLYVTVKISPRDSGHFLLPEYVLMADSIRELNLEGPEGQTVGEYLQTAKKEPVFVGLNLGINGEGHIGWCDPQGNLYYYIDAKMPEDGLLHVSGTARTMQMQEVSRVEFDFAVENRASVQETAAGSYDERIDESGIHMENITVRETELGYYVTFTWRKLYENRSVTLSLTDAEGEYLPIVPGFGSGQEINEDGTYTQTLAVQKTVNAEDLYFVIRWGQLFGPYSVLSK